MQDSAPLLFLVKWQWPPFNSPNSATPNNSSNIRKSSTMRLNRRKYWIAGVDAPSNDPSAMDVAAASLAASRKVVAAVLATL